MFATLGDLVYPGSIQAWRIDGSFRKCPTVGDRREILRPLDRYGQWGYLWLMSTAKTAGTDWTDDEIDLIVADYLTC